MVSRVPGLRRTRITGPQLLCAGAVIALLTLGVPLAPVLLSVARFTSTVVGTLHLPRIPPGLPAGIETIPTYVRQITRDPVTRRRAAALRRLLAVACRGCAQRLVPAVRSG